MGKLQADEMARLLAQEQVLQWHLQHNHYPPVNLVFVPTAQEAIQHYNDDDWNFVIKMPNGKELSAGRIVEELHLESFLHRWECWYCVDDEEENDPSYDTNSEEE